MMEQESYKSRAVAVRRSARAHVLEIRRARIARRRAATAAAQTPEPVIDEVPQATQAEPDESELIEPALSGDAEDNSNDVSSDVPDTEDAPADRLDDDAIMNAAVEELSETTADSTAPDLTDQALTEASSGSEADDQAGSEEDTSDECVEPAPDLPKPPEDTQLQADPEPMQTTPDEADVAEDMRPSDLDRLPGAGPGLIWMLNQCEIFTLADLAAQEAADLSPKLGVVGQILDVERWIAFAAEQAET